MKFKNFILYLAIGLFVYFPLFYHLDYDTIRDWDESRLACNALEMATNGNYIVTYYDGVPDMWNTKPPLMIWLQVASFNLFGYTELAIRIPSAIAALLTVALLLFFCFYYLKNKILGLVTVLMLLTSQGYISYHVTRTGDYDALLTLFITMYCLAYYIYVSFNEKNKPLFLYVFFVALTLAVLSKGVAGLFFLPVIVLLTIFKKKTLHLLKSPHFYLGFVFFVFIIGGYYLLREQYNPGFLQAVYENELGGRYMSTIEQHKHEFSYYFTNFQSGQFQFWLYFFPAGLLLLFLYYKKNEPELFKAGLYITSLILFVFFLLSFSQTKLLWYVAPLFPFMAMICAIPVTWLIDKAILLNESLSTAKKYIFILGIFLAFGFYPYKIIIETISHGDKYTWKHLLFGHFMRNTSHIKNYSVSYNGYNASADFYVGVFNLQGYNVQTKIPEAFVKNDTVLVCEQEVMGKINQMYEYTVLHQWDQCFMLKINSNKN